jgi:hypothetical protein
MTKYTLIFSTVLITLILSSCSPKLVGTWTVAKYETTTPGKQATTLSNIGTMRFDKNGHGQKDLEYRLFDQTRVDKEPFQWESMDNYVVIQSESSQFAKTWILITDKKKEQKWKSTDGANEVHILELIKTK